MQVKKQQSEPCVEQLTSSEFRNEYDKAVYCHPVYLTYMQRTPGEILGWIVSQAGNKTAGRNINNLRYVDDITLTAESKEGLKNLLMRVKKKSTKASLKLNTKKSKIVESGPISSW